MALDISMQAKRPDWIETPQAAGIIQIYVVDACA